jgi:GNAT superfamily N-acetyltransferase
MDDLAEQSLDAMPEIDALRESIGWGPGSWFLEPMVAAGGCVLGRRDADGKLTAMGATARFGSMGFICNMVVRPGLKRQGLARGVFAALLEWLKQREIANVQLEATEEGKPLYEQFGFRTRWESVSARKTKAVERGHERGIAALGSADWPALVALDRIATGAERGDFLRRLAAGPYEPKGLVIRQGGRLTGFGFGWDQRIGPVVAATPDAAEQIARALASRAADGAFATVGHPQHAAIWERLGFDVGPFDVRMALGPEPGDRPEMVISMLNGGVG